MVRIHRELVKRKITNNDNSNQVDLRILREMGIDVDRRKYEKPLRPIQKFRAGVFTIMAAIRMSNMERQWREVKLIGEDLKAVRSRHASAKTTVRVRSVREV
jgi:hypothetical protein